jgi:hypothetical protein
MEREIERRALAARAEAKPVLGRYDGPRTGHVLQKGALKTIRNFLTKIPLVLIMFLSPWRRPLSGLRIEGRPMFRW